MKGLISRVVLCVAVLALCLGVVAPVEAGGFFRQAFVAPIVVPQAFVAQRVVVPRQRFVLAPQAIVVPNTFGIQRVVVPSAFGVPAAAFSLPIVGGGCGALIVQ